MSLLRLNINGRELTARPGQTILEVARENGIEIPTLCHAPYLESFGSCGLCLVEVEGIPKLLRSCATKVQDGMVITTDSDRLRRARKVALELLLSDHLGDCRSPCYMACPTNCDAQGYIALIANGYYREALELIKETLPIPAAIGRVCPHPCEEVCRRNLVDEPVSICALKRLAADLDLESEEPYRPQLDPPTGKRVAIVGSGPAGLTAAYFLAQKGHAVTIFEQLPEPGGMLRYGIPEYRLPKAVLDKEIATITALGVEIKTGVALGKDFTLEYLFASGYDAVFLALGAQKSRNLGIEGEELAGVYGGTEFLRQVTLNGAVQVGRRVAVIGGGNTAMDAARTALRLGAQEVTILYRRSREEMPALDIEVEEAQEEGVKFQFLAAPVKIIGENGKVHAIQCRKMRLGEPDASGRRRPEPIPGSEFTLEVDTIIAAIGQVPDLTGLEGKIATGRGSTITVEPGTYKTNIPGVFAGGDVVTGPGIAVEAVAAGKEAAFVIDSYLNGQLIPYQKPFVVQREEVPAEEYAHIEKQPRVRQQVLPPEERIRHFREITAGLTPEQGQREAQRCLECGCMDVFECQLRLYAALYGAEPQRFAGEVNTNEKETHPFIIRDPNKCILCAQCVRTCDEVRGVGVLGFVNRGFDVVIKPAFDLPLLETECEACGQCISTCPTGALMAKSHLVKPGPWELKTTTTTCPYCSVGCTLQLKTRGRLLADVTPHAQSPVDDGNLCRRGRFAPGLLVQVDRLTAPLVRKDGKLVPVSWEEALSHLAKGVAAVKATTPSSARAVFASPRLTNEELYLIQKWARSALETNNLNTFTRSGTDPLLTALGRAAATNSLAEIPAAELILLVGSTDLSLSHAIVGLKVKEAAAKGAQLITIGAQKGTLSPLIHRELDLPPEASTRILEGLLAVILEEKLYDQTFVREKTSGLAALQEKLASFDWSALVQETGITRDQLLELARLWVQAKSGLILYDEDCLSPEAASLLVDLALLAGKIGKPRRGIIPLRPKNNSQGLLDMGVLPTHLPGYLAVQHEPGLDTQGVLAAVRRGDIKALFIFGEDPVGTAEDPAEMSAALQKASLLVVQDITLTPTAELANVVLPAATFAESEGTFTNLERRIQPVNPALTPPAGLQNWQILLKLARATGCNWDYRSLGELWREMTANVPILKGITLPEVLAKTSQWGDAVLYRTGFAQPDGRARFLVPDTARLMARGYPHHADYTEKLFADKLKHEGFWK